jgi:hypothetical protein
MRPPLGLTLALLAGCVSGQLNEGSAAAPPLPGMVTCGDRSVPSFPLAVLDQPGGADPDEDQPAALLQAVVRESVGTLPESGWIRAVETADIVMFVARGGAGMAWSMAKFQLRDGEWQADAYGQCRLQPAIPDGVNLAVFRLATDDALAPEATQLDLLVTETACNSGQDARGRIRVLDVVPAGGSISILLGVVPRPGGQECPSNPETPFTIELPEPLGDRVVLDGSSVPPRDATTCPDMAVCP